MDEVENSKNFLVQTRLRSFERVESLASRLRGLRNLNCFSFKRFLISKLLILRRQNNFIIRDPARCIKIIGTREIAQPYSTAVKYIALWSSHWRCSLSPLENRERR